MYSAGEANGKKSTHNSKRSLETSVVEVGKNSMGNKSSSVAFNDASNEVQQPLTEHNDVKNKESSTLIWFDPTIGSNQDTEHTKQQLRSINDYVIFHTDLDECIRSIQSIDKEKVFLITSGVKAPLLLPHVSELRQLDSVFVFCMNRDRYKHLLDEYAKIIGIYTELGELYASIRQELEHFHEHLQTFSIFDQHQKCIKTLSQQSAEFLWFQLFHHVILDLPRNQQAKQRMIDVCRNYYRGNKKQLKLIDEFERDYRPEDAIRWYSKQSFVYRLVNKALRNEDLEQLRAFRFFIGDLSKQLAQKQQTMLSSAKTNLTLYRGTKLDREEFERLKENQGKTISTNGYLSTSRRKQPALRFAMKTTQRTDVVGVLFQIHCDVENIGTSVIYADITAFSMYPAEKEVLFDMNASFKLDSIEDEGSIQVINMSVSNQGEKITKNYIELMQTQIEEKSAAIVFGRLMCDMGEYHRSQVYFEELLREPNEEDVAWIELNIGRALDYKSEWEEARKYYERAHDRMISADPPRLKDSAQAIKNGGCLLHHQGKYDDALCFYQQALKIRKMCYPSGHADIATTLNNIGVALCRLERYDEALEHHKCVLEMNEKLYPSGHAAIANCLNNIGQVLYSRGEFDDAYGYYQKALQMRKEYYPSDHVDISVSLNNIGNVLSNQGRFDEALGYYHQAFEMQEKFYPSGHPHIAKTLHGTGDVLRQQEKYDSALDYYQQAYQMRERFLSSDDVRLAVTLDSIGCCYEKQARLELAFEFYQKALTIYQKRSPVGHHGRLKTEQSIRRITSS